MLKASCAPLLPADAVPSGRPGPLANPAGMRPLAAARAAAGFLH